MNWLYNFKAYCLTTGVNLLPDDRRFMEKMLYKIPEDRRRQIAKNYHDEWLKALENAPNATMAQNYARNRANNYLRDVCMGN